MLAYPLVLLEEVLLGKVLYRHEFVKVDRHMYCVQYLYNVYFPFTNVGGVVLYYVLCYLVIPYKVTHIYTNYL